MICGIIQMAEAYCTEVLSIWYEKWVGPPEMFFNVNILSVFHRIEYYPTNATKNIYSAVTGWDTVTFTVLLGSECYIYRSRLFTFNSH